MSLRVVRLGSPRLPGEGLRLGTVRRPPRGVPRARFAADDWYDCFFPVLAPSEALRKAAFAADTPTRWRSFQRRYRSEMSMPAPRQAIAVLAALSRQADFSVGCYCEDPQRCHRSILQALLVDAGARLAGGTRPGSRATAGR